jgi:hypothetical protein
MVIDLKADVKAAQERVEEARLERIRKAEEARQLREALEQRRIWKSIEPDVIEIRKYLEANSNAGYNRFTYPLADDNPDFEGFHYNFKITKDSPTDYLIRYLKDAGLTVEPTFTNSHNYGCGEDWTSTDHHTLEISF